MRLGIRPFNSGSNACLLIHLSRLQQKVALSRTTSNPRTKRRRVIIRRERASDQQHGRSRGLARGEIGMGPRGFFQRIGLMDLDLDRA